MKFYEITSFRLSQQDYGEAHVPNTKEFKFVNNNVTNQQQQSAI